MFTLDSLFDMLKEFIKKEIRNQKEESEKREKELQKDVDDIIIQYNELSYFTDQLINYAKTKDIYTEDFIKDKDPRRRFRDVRLHY